MADKAAGGVSRDGDRDSRDVSKEDLGLEVMETSLPMVKFSEFSVPLNPS